MTVLLVIIGGFGWRDASGDNAVRLAHTPWYDALWEHGPRGFLRVCGPDLGVSLGDSALSYRNIGGGRIVWRDAPADSAGGLGEAIAQAGLPQLRVATPAAISLVTTALDGGIAVSWPGARQIAAEDPVEPVLEAITDGEEKFIALHLDQADLAGHSGDLAKAIAGVEAADAALGRLSQAIQGSGGAMLVTADHGNCEMMRDPATGLPHAGHTSNDVPVVLCAPGTYLFRDGRLADVAPTLLKLLGLARPARPARMTGRPLLRGNMEALHPVEDADSPFSLITYMA